MQQNYIPAALAHQRAHIEKLTEENFAFGLTVGAGFVRSMRKSGYKNTAKALDELIDNSFESGAANVHVACGYEGGRSDKKPEQIAVIDDGIGMYPEMVRLAVTWGGTDRENSRSGIGRFGFGLPSSCVSQGKRFEVYSKVEDGEWHAAIIDLEEIERGVLTTKQGHIVVPAPKPAKLRPFVQDYIRAHVPGGELKRGTVVVIDKLDEVTWKTTNGLQDNLLRHFGVTYYKKRSLFEVFVNGIRCEPIDPLFQTPGFRWYDLDEDRVTTLDPFEIKVKDKESREEKGMIRVRFSWMPITFASKDKSVVGDRRSAGKNHNDRWDILKDMHGIIISRMGRVIDTVIPPSKYTTFLNYDRFNKIEIDFDAGLDEEFNVPTTKQRVDVSDRIWDILEEHGLFKTLEQMRGKTKTEAKARAIKTDTDPQTPRPSEIAMQAAEAASPKLPSAGKEEKLREGRDNLRREAGRIAARNGRQAEEVERELEAEWAGRPYKVEKRAVPGGNFFEVEYFGGTKRLWLNTDSRFYGDLYAAPGTTSKQRFALEVLLFSIGDCILDARDEFRAMYTVELPAWTRKLEYSLAQLERDANAGVAVEGEEIEVEAA